MTSAGPGHALVPLAEDLEAAVRLTAQALEHAARIETPPQDPEPTVAWASERLRAGSVEGRLLCSGGRPTGVVLWEPASDLGRRVQVLTLAEGHRSPEEYRTFLELADREAGPFHLLPAGWPGLSPEEEATLLEPRGYRTFARSEMRFPTDRPIPEEPLPSGITLRPVRVEDEPSLVEGHAAAFGGHFDAYLFHADPDPHRSSLLEVRDMLSGRWGPFLPWASFLAEDASGRHLGSCLFVRAPYGPLLASLQVDPAAHGRGIGRALTVASLRALRARGETVIALNVTEGNARALRLYRSLGFVRTLGPGAGWYSTRQIPVGPDGRPSLPAAPRGSGSRAPGAPQSRPA